MRNFFGVLSLIFFFSGCKTAQEPKIPTRIPITNQVTLSSKTGDEELQLQLENHMKAPVRFYVSAEDKKINNLFKELQPVTLKPEQDTLITIPIKDHPDLQPAFKINYGDLERPVIHSPVSLPVRRYKPIKILQGHGGSYSHNEDRSRYAIDFALPVGDTVYSASDGYVVQMMEEYKYGGGDSRWMDLGNRIFVYDPDTGRYFQYSHLVHQGSFVEQGDRVKQGQPIGLSGNTGFSDTPHLHFNVMIPDTSKAGLRSVPVDFIEGFKGADLKKKVILEQEKT